MKSVDAQRRLFHLQHHIPSKAGVGKSKLHVLSAVACCSFRGVQEGSWQQKSINRSPWSCCRPSDAGDYICASVTCVIGRSPILDDHDTITSRGDLSYGIVSVEFGDEVRASFIYQASNIARRIDNNVLCWLLQVTHHGFNIALFCFLACTKPDAKTSKPSVFCPRVTSTNNGTT